MTSSSPALLALSRCCIPTRARWITIRTSIWSCRPQRSTLSKSDGEPNGATKAKGAYLFNHDALAKVFRAKLLAALEAAGLELPCRYPKQWVVDCKSVGSGAPALVYLGRYLYRGVIRENDILACNQGQVRFRYRHAKTGKMEHRTVSGAHFLWLVLQHVLPKGFRRARNFGFLHPNCKRLIALLHVLLKFAPRPSARMVQAATRNAVLVLRGTDEDRANADSLFAPALHPRPHCPPGSPLTM